MSVFSESGDADLTRREFLTRSVVIGGLCLINCSIEATQQSEPTNIEKALNDKSVIHGMVSFKSGSGEIKGYMARPASKGRFPIVVVVIGSTIQDQHNWNTTAMLAQNGFIGIAPDIYSLQKEGTTIEERRKVLAEQITDERIFQDIQASIDYVKTQDFAKPPVGIMGFCFGGRCALMFTAAHANTIHAVVPFYGNLKTPAFANRKEDPIDVVNKIKTPVQGHYAELDREIPSEQLQTFKSSLKKNGVEVEIFTYQAPHGFSAFNQPTYNAAAANLSWQRTIAFFKQHLYK
jgi:carboxymethylenebutenolidase